MHALVLPPRSTSLTTSVAASILLSTVAVHPNRTGAAVAVVLAIAVFAADIDRRTGRLPDALIAIAALPLVAAAPFGVLVPMCIGAALLAVPIAAVHVAAPDAMGFGDVKFAVVLGGALGLIDPRWSVVALCVASVITAGIGLARGRGTLPFGPGLAAGTFVAVILSAAMPTVFVNGRPSW